MNPATIPTVRDVWVAVVNSHGNEDECLDVFPGPFLGSRPIFIMLRDGQQYVCEGYWFDVGHLANIRGSNAVPLEWCYRGEYT